MAIIGGYGEMIIRLSAFFGIFLFMAIAEYLLPELAPLFWTGLNAV